MAAKAAPLPVGWKVSRIAGSTTWLVWDTSRGIVNAAASRAAAEELARAEKVERRAMDWYAMDERALERRVLRLFKQNDFSSYHTYNAYRSAPGYPDFHAWRVRDRRSLFAELKTMRGTLSDDQQRHLDELDAVGHETYIVRPCDLENFERLLSRTGRPSWTDRAPALHPNQHLERNSPNAAS